MLLISFEYTAALADIVQDMGSYSSNACLYISSTPKPTAHLLNNENIQYNLCPPSFLPPPAPQPCLFVVPFQWKLNPDLQRENVHSTNVSSIAWLLCTVPCSKHLGFYLQIKRRRLFLGSLFSNREN